MRDVYTVRLELLRFGTAHNQLLSPLTPYVALCGNDGPVTVTIPLEHRHLLNRLERLRYVVDSALIPETQRQAELVELGSLIGRVLANIPALNAQLGPASAHENALVHLQLVVWGSELALVPFEVVTSPDGFPGAGQPLLTQGDVPVTLTREVRRARPLPVEWDRAPRVLFASAEPPGVSPVPVRAHLIALRRALEPWIPWSATPEQRVGEVQQRLTVLHNATLDDIRQACSTKSFTHVHILAHGVERTEAGERRYGVVLNRDRRHPAADVVDGQALAQALRVRSQDGRSMSRPTAVTLATCDSGAVGSPLTPGGSIAHDLHAFGVPWVIASQLPMTIAGSVLLTECWYSHVLRGDDPRWVVHELRRRLNSDSRTKHDWASLAVYAVTPQDLAAQVSAFRSRQTKTSVDVLFDKAERMSDVSHSDIEPIKKIFVEIRHALERWRSEAPAGDTPEARRERGERIGLTAAAEKRIALLLREHAPADDGRGQSEKEADDAMARARDLYHKAFLEDWTNHWVLTQFLSLNAVYANRSTEGIVLSDWWIVARSLALQQCRDTNATSKAWAFATLAEIELLGFAFGNYSAGQATEVTGRVAQYCRTIAEIMGDDSFHVRSTRRQFERYARWWSADRPEWQQIIAAALRALPQSPHGFHWTSAAP
jgi:CHAT domain-containing protein